MPPGFRVLGSVPYRQALALQERLSEEVARGVREDTWLVLEHPPTVTLGKRSAREDLLVDEATLAERGIDVVRVGRGGGATYHGPGQIVGYPIVRLTAAGRGVRRFVDDLERTLVAACARLGVGAEPEVDGPGLWAGGRKIAAIGLEVRHRVVRHGFALNVDMDLSGFDCIVPCRSPRLDVGDLSRVAGRRIGADEAIAALHGAWLDRFGRAHPDRPHEGS